jgi:carbon monoxide dehydrogenase subunit G
MAHYSTTITSPLTPEAAFAYMADLRNFADWDPGVRRVTQISGQGGGNRATFDVVVAGAAGRDMTLRYVTTRYEPPTTIQAEARSRMFTSIDRIDVVPDGRGCRVTYDADLRLNGPLALLDPALKLAFKRIGDRAAAGLATALDGRRVGP